MVKIWYFIEEDWKKRIESNLKVCGMHPGY